MKRELTILVDDVEYVVTVSRQGDRLIVERGDEAYEVTIRSDRRVNHQDADPASPGSADVRQTAAVSRTPALAAGSAPAGMVSVPSPMVGVVREIHVAAGAAVAEGDRLVTMEAMKMEIYVTAPCPGSVAEVLCSAGDTVTDGAELLRISAGGAGSS